MRRRLLHAFLFVPWLAYTMYAATINNSDNYSLAPKQALQCTDKDMLPQHNNKTLPALAPAPLSACCAAVCASTRCFVLLNHSP